MHRLVLSLILVLCPVFCLAQQKDQDVFNPIAKYLAKGDAESLSAWFADNLELNVVGVVNDCSKNQAKQILRNFFVNYTPKSFEILHKSGSAIMKYAVGTLSAGGEKFNVTLFVKTSENGNYIQQLKIEKQ